MQRDLIRMLRRRRRLKRIAAILILTAVAALAVVLMRTCTDRFDEPYNKEYQPMDTHRHDVEKSF